MAVSDLEPLCGRERSKSSQAKSRAQPRDPILISAPESTEGFAEPAMVRIPEGWFMRGWNSGRDDERPEHRVWVDAFELAAYQVTNRDYARFLAEMKPEKPLHWPLHWGDANFDHPDQPVVAVSWLDAMAYCDWLSKRSGLPCPARPTGGRQAGRRYRLPSEAEWERAARGGLEGKSYPWGDEPPETLPDYAARWKSGPEPVGRYAANGFGLYNIGDNVHEWCSDWYDPGYYARSPERNPAGPAEGKRRASRGGSWRHHIKVSRCAARSSIPPEFKYADYGFRVARDRES